jgi:hypothetical protein
MHGVFASVAGHMLLADRSSTMVAGHCVVVKNTPTHPMDPDSCVTFPTPHTLISCADARDTMTARATAQRSMLPWHAMQPRRNQSTCRQPSLTWVLADSQKPRGPFSFALDIIGARLTLATRRVLDCGAGLNSLVCDCASVLNSIQTCVCVCACVCVCVCV